MFEGCQYPGSDDEEARCGAGAGRGGLTAAGAIGRTYVGANGATVAGGSGGAGRPGDFWFAGEPERAPSGGPTGLSFECAMGGGGTDGSGMLEVGGLGAGASAATRSEGLAG